MYLTTMFSCQNTYDVPEEINSIPVEINIKRFDQEFKNLDNSRFLNLKSNYPYLFPVKYPDRFWLDKSNDSIQKGLRDAVMQVFHTEDIKALETELEFFYKHLLFYYPQMKLPEVISITNDVDYKNSIIEGRGKLLIALDCYLGANHEFYQNISDYVIEHLTQEQIVIDVAEVYAEKIIGRNRNREFISLITHYGKQLYITKQLVPFKKINEVLRYDQKQWEWANANEKFTWQYFIDKQMLFSTNKNLTSRFVQEAPFTKFYLDFDAETPARLGQYMGYKIVSSFMKHNKVSLQQLIELDSKYIFEHSKYKPKK